MPKDEMGPRRAPAAKGLAAIELRANTSYFDLIDSAFLALVSREGLGEIRGDAWITDATALEAAGGERLFGASYHAAGRSEALVRLDGVLAHLLLQGEHLNVRLAAAGEKPIEVARAELRRAFPEIDSDARHEAKFTFWWATEHAVQSLVRPLAVPSLEDVAANYAGQARAALGRLAEMPTPDEGGRLILWHGEPGAGKTYAVRALAWEWREWCEFHYVTDPDALFAQGSSYLIQMVTQRAGRRCGTAGGDRWRCLVLEDTGELMSADAKQRTGQALSRLLNVVDGLIGQGFNVLVLVTTNEPLRKLHPAVVRPGRCLAEVEFTALSVEEANCWLADNGSALRVSSPTSLAELFAMLAGGTERSGEPKFGFAA